jgi:hypothetical protein
VRFMGQHGGRGRVLPFLPRAARSSLLDHSRSAPRKMGESWTAHGKTSNNQTRATSPSLKILLGSWEAYLPGFFFPFIYYLDVLVAPRTEGP